MMISSPSEGGRQRLVWSLIIAGSEIFLGLPSANKVQSIRGVGGRYGALGHDDNETNHMVPARIQGFKKNAIISRIACGRWHSVALANSRELVCWGRNHSGQLGLGFVSRACAKPTAIELEPGERHTPLIHDIAAGTILNRHPPPPD